MVFGACIIPSCLTFVCFSSIAALCVCTARALRCCALASHGLVWRASTPARKMRHCCRRWRPRRWRSDLAMGDRSHPSTRQRAQLACKSPWIACNPYWGGTHTHRSWTRTRGRNTSLLIADCRPKANAVANRAAGGGYTSYSFSRLVFLGIANIHAVRDAHRRVSTLSGGGAASIAPGTRSCPPASSSRWWADVEDSGWLGHVRTILAGGARVARALHR